jgi:hypothetical protein
MRLVNIVKVAIEEKILGNAKARNEWMEAMFARVLAQHHNPDGYAFTLDMLQGIDTDRDKVAMDVDDHGTVTVRPAAEDTKARGRRTSGQPEPEQPAA